MNESKTMNAVLLRGYGDFEQLEYSSNVPIPKSKENEVLIEVKAAGVNNTDINTRIGWYAKTDSKDEASWDGASLKFPRIQGADVCGYIVKVGINVDLKRIGERVLV